MRSEGLFEELEEPLINAGRGHEDGDFKSGVEEVFGKPARPRPCMRIRARFPEVDGAFVADGGRPPPAQKPTEKISKAHFFFEDAKLWPNQPPFPSGCEAVSRMESCRTTGAVYC